MKAQSRALGLNKQHINMARLKVKQISDFSSAVQNLIDNDADQNASIIEQISEDLSSEVVATNGDVTSIDAVLASVGGNAAIVAVSNALSAEIEATDDDFTSADTRFSNAESTDVVLSNALSAEIEATDDDFTSADTRFSNAESTDVVLSNALSTEILATNADFTSVDAVLASVGGNAAIVAVSNALSAEIEATDDDFTSADTRFGSVDTRLSGAESTDVVLSAEINTEKGRIDAILAGSDADLNQFSEVISYVDSLDTADGGALTSQIASLEGVVSTNTSSDVVLSTALSAEIVATNGDVTSIDAVLASVGGNAAITAVSNALSAEIEATDDDFTSADTRFGSVDTRFSGAESTDVVLSNALSAEIEATDDDVTSLDSYIDGVSAALSGEISATGSEIDSLDVALNGFAKEAYIHGAFSGIVTGGAMTTQVVDTTGVQLDGGATATEAGSTVAVDLVRPIEGNSDLEMEANLMFVTINGQYVNHDAIRINSATQFSIIGSQLGFALEADDVLEFKYIKD